MHTIYLHQYFIFLFSHHFLRFSISSFSFFAVDEPLGTQFSVYKNKIKENRLRRKMIITGEKKVSAAFFFPTVYISCLCLKEVTFNIAYIFMKIYERYHRDKDEKKPIGRGDWKKTS